jgi:osmotically-inducible protein OsmY
MSLPNRMLAVVAVAALLGLAGCATDSDKKEGDGNFLNDSGITAEVKTMIFNQTGFRTFNVNVTTENRVVHLTGTVKSREEMTKVVEAARRVGGVRSVKNDLKIQP